MNGQVLHAAVAPGSVYGRRLRILTWHVHGNYLYSLSHLPHDFYIPVSAAAGPGYGALGTRIPWGDNMHEVAPEALRRLDFDCILYQSRVNLEDAIHLLDPAQRRKPAIYLEHDPPQPHATDTRHFFEHDMALVVHVTPYNALMWDNGDMPVRIIDHGVPAPVFSPPTTTLPQGVAAVNHLHRRGRRMGADVFDWFRAQLPLDLIGMESEEHGGLGEVPNMEVAAFVARYRYFFSPVRYGSLSMGLVEAMMAGVPVVGLATTELPCVVQNGIHGYVDTHFPRLLDVMRNLQADAGLARGWGDAARDMARQRFALGRFVADWNAVLLELMEAHHGGG